jgi:integrase
VSLQIVKHEDLDLCLHISHSQLRTHLTCSQRYLFQYVRGIPWEFVPDYFPFGRSIHTSALNTGMRKGEILNLNWDNVDLKHGFILLSQTKNGERREIPINGTLRETLSELFRGTEERPRRINVPYVFYDYPTGNRFQSIQKSFKSACNEAKIKDFRFHDLRHTFASHLVMAGVDLTTVRELLGHKTITMTLRYAHLAPSHKVKAVDLLDNSLNFSSAQLEHKKGAASL